mmetsp:Transcript_33802/g.78015  ORF Transcript_33802/g.78015 Transcript_33802/m.78015 type:complete len:82 (-) Transcript_33802:233-478(-)
MSSTLYAGAAIGVCALGAGLYAGVKKGVGATSRKMASVARDKEHNKKMKELDKKAEEKKAEREARVARLKAKKDKLLEKKS